jgi:hypothetical protein
MGGIISAEGQYDTGGYLYSEVRTYIRKSGSSSWIWDDVAGHDLTTWFTTYSGVASGTWEIQVVLRYMVGMNFEEVPSNTVKVVVP